MALKYLFGPVSATFAADNLHGPRQAGDCLAFDAAGTTDLTIGPGDSWESVCGRLPGGWRPDFVALYLPYTTIPACLWDAPVPLVGLASDWNFLFHHLRRRLPCCDLVLTDTAGVEIFARGGMDHARSARLFGLERPWLEEQPAEGARDIDILFVGNLHPAVQRERLPWLGRLARLGERWNVEICTSVFGPAYRELLRRARVVFNRSVRGECNRRVVEAAAAGALLFQEAENREVPAWFRDGQECVYYRDDNLEERLEYYLTHEDERRAIAARAREHVAAYSFEELWRQQVEAIEREWNGIRERMTRRPKLAGAWSGDHAPTEAGARSGDHAPTDGLVARTWEMQGSATGPDLALVPDLAAGIRERPGAAALHNALGVAVGMLGSAGGPVTDAQARAALEHFQRAWECDPAYLMAGLNLAEALAGVGQGRAAVEQARRTLRMLDWLPELDGRVLDAPRFPAAFDYFRVEWERAAWVHAGRPAEEAGAKRDLLRWRLHQLIAEGTKELSHYQEAVMARPDLPISQAALGCALGRAGRLGEAAPHLRQAVADNPFDHPAAQALAQVLSDTGQAAERQALDRQRRLLAKAAPQVVPVEEWFAEPAAEASIQVEAGAAEAPLGIVWEGAQAAVHSFARLNREVGRRLLQRGHDLAILPSGPPIPPADAVAVPAELAERFHRKPDLPIVAHVRHQWPPDFTPPPAGHWVMLQPWEFGSLPKAWLEPFRSRVDEVWVPSHFVRRCYLQSGVPTDRVHVVPSGIDPQLYHPQAPPLPLRTSKRFKFLFVGGTIGRKGIDILLEAYSRTFCDRDDVCLVIKDMGGGSFYQGQTAQQAIALCQARPAAPAIEYIDRPLSEAEMAGLYTACDCLVHPYRGEGFGLPIAEAMACGLPVIVTGYGAALDFCNEDNAYLIPAQVVRWPRKAVGDLETVDFPWLAEASADALRYWLRYVVEHPEEARGKGQAGSAHIHGNFTWDHTVAAVEGRLRQLQQRAASWGNFPSCPEITGKLETCPTKRVSLCMIVKNEEANLPGCLLSAADLFNEIVIVDTGSTDATKEVAKQFGARVFDFAWVDDFAAARNESLRHATGQWIFWLDGDDRIDDGNRERLRGLFTKLTDENAAYSLKCRCARGGPDGVATLVDHVRLFRNHPGIRWRYRVHEQILPAIRETNGVVYPSDVVIDHVGYQDAAAQGPKNERNLRLLRLDLAEHPDDPFILFNLGWAYADMGRPAEALPLLRASLERSDPSASIVRKLYPLIMACHRQLGQQAAAMAACREGQRHYPEDAELLFREAQLRQEMGDGAGAEECLRRLIHGREGPHFGSVADGLRGHLALHELARLCRQQGRHAEAEEYWRAALAERPDYGPARQGLEELGRARSA
jgi:glycosyltransferase involved in cell wall biosynthesis/Tfp pilus assembly protein PilF